jgi:hypothetical protein
MLCYVLATLCIGVLVAIGYALTGLYRRAGWPDGSDAINCWSFAVARWLEAGTADHYLITRRSRHAMVPHVFFADSIEGIEVEELKPLKPQRGWKGFFNSFNFKGRIRKGKGEE